MQRLLDYFYDIYWNKRKCSVCFGYPYPTNLYLNHVPQRYECECDKSPQWTPKILKDICKQFGKTCDPSCIGCGVSNPDLEDEWYCKMCLKEALIGKRCFYCRKPNPNKPPESVEGEYAYIYFCPDHRD